MTVVAICRMDLKYFPMDTQICELDFESYGYPREEVDYNWNETSLNETTLKGREMSLPNFRVINLFQQKKILKMSGIESKAIYWEWII